MNHYICKSSNQHALKAVKEAEEIVNLYLRGRKRDSLIKTVVFFDELNMYLFGKTQFLSKFGKTTQFPPIEDFSKKIKMASEVKFNEYTLALGRAINCNNGDKILECGYEHNASFIDWFLYDVGLIDKDNRFKELSKARKTYLKSLNFTFVREDEDKYKGRAKLFYRSAYRAEMYSHNVYTDAIKDGFHDMYTPLILTRMGVEQYLKSMYESKMKVDAPSKASTCREELEKKKYISKSLSNEIYAVLKRGNVNTHEGYANYSFAIIHGIEILKECLKYFNRNK